MSDSNLPENIKIEKELNIARAQLLQQILDIKEKFYPKIDLMKTNFFNKYDDNCSNLSNQLKQFDIKMEKVFGQEKEMEIFKKKVNQSLEKILENLNINIQKFYEQMETYTNNIVKIISHESLNELDDYANQLILKRENEKKIEEESIKSIGNLNDYDQIILKDFSKENLENIFNQSNNAINSTNEIIFKNCNLENLDMGKLFPNINKLKIKNSKLAFDIKNNFNMNNIEILKLENIGLIDNNFNDLFDKIRTNEQIRTKLKVFSVKNNKISFIDYKRGYADNILSSMIFTNLEILDFSYNKLYLFPNQIFNCLEKIKFIDLTDNNISFPQNIIGLIKSAKIKKCLLLLTRNLAILKEPENIEYNNYLKENLTKIDFPIRKIVLDNIFCGKLFNNIFDLDFSFFKNSLEYLDLSNSQLHDNDLISLFNNQKIYFSNLKKLYLVANYLTQEFLYNLSSDNKYLMDNLTTLRLSENEIKCTDVTKFKKFLEFFKNLISLELKCTPFEKNVNQYFRKKIIQSYDPENKKGYTKPLDEDEKKVEEILSGHYLQNTTKIWINILDLNGGKYTEKIVQSFPELIERINVENKFPYKT